MATILGYIGTFLNTYREAIFLGPGPISFRNLVVRPIALAGDVIEHIKGVEYFSPEMRNLIAAAKSAKEAIGVVMFARGLNKKTLWGEESPTTEIKYLDKSNKEKKVVIADEKMQKGLRSAATYASQAGFTWGVYECVTSLAKLEIIAVPVAYETYLNWFGTAAGTCNTVTSVYNEYLKQCQLKDVKDMSPLEIGYTRSYHLLLGSGAILTAFFCPLFTDRISKVWKLAGFCSAGLGLAGMAYFGYAKEKALKEQTKQP